MMASGYTSFANGTGTPFKKIGTRIPPPVHVKTI